jgi:hypothetical protein
LSAPNDDALAAATAQGIQTNPNNETASLPDADEWRAAVAQRDKRYATLRAQFALRGFELNVISEAGAAMFVVSKWGMTRSARTLDELNKIAVQFGVLS